MNDNSKRLRRIEKELEKMNLSPEEAAKKLKMLAKAYDVELEGFRDDEIALREGAVIIGQHDSIVTQATAKGGYLWANGKRCVSTSGAAAAVTGIKTRYGRAHWRVIWDPVDGFGPIDDQWLKEPDQYEKRS